MDVQEELRQLRGQIAFRRDTPLMSPLRWRNSLVGLTSCRCGIPCRPLLSARLPISAVACSFGPSDASFAELEVKSEAPPIDALFMDSEEEEFTPSAFEESFVGAPGYASAVRPQQVVGCGAPPFGLRPHFIMLACFLGLLAFGIAGVAAGFGGIGINNVDNNPVTEDPVMCIGAACIYSGVEQLSPETRQLVLQLFAEAGGGAAAPPGGDWGFEHETSRTFEVHLGVGDCGGEGRGRHAVGSRGQFRIEVARVRIPARAASKLTRTVEKDATGSGCGAVSGTTASPAGACSAAGSAR
ncbi:hypothetical protein CYMTET_24814 [Cymbomonas tetramitiformis]|uniref:Uncharacterized protein n=1 Tax=Cymbomonas tetramitiformis TaxID=36881 RepID=A0AAE0FWJ8_9CHLO|nr:hypothetical protein CYMTET_24814 [Cymbomonas tetramitiformis]